MKIKLSDRTEQAFRESAMHEFGFQKGAFSLAAEQALGIWTRQHEDVSRLKKAVRGKIKDPVKSLRGMVKGVKIDSVSLVHEVYRERSERWKKHVSH